jgi:hypothetical protein
MFDPEGLSTWDDMKTYGTLAVSALFPNATSSVMNTANTAAGSYKASRDNGQSFASSAYEATAIVVATNSGVRNVVEGGGGFELNYSSKGQEANSDISGEAGKRIAKVVTGSIQLVATGAAVQQATGLGSTARNTQTTSNIEAANTGASSAINKVKLEKQLASEEQLGQLSTGRGTVISQPAKQAERIARQTGRDAKDIQKVSSDARTAADGQHIQTHTFRDASDNTLIEPKTILDPTEN